jgi:Domain of unknown function (DUF4157)
MNGRRGRGAGGEDGDDHGDPAPVAGRVTRSALRYGGGHGAAGDEAPTIHDVATRAVEQKDAGRTLDDRVAGTVGAHLGRDFSSVRVHDDPHARGATAAMGARAFAYGGDVFLGPGESDRDLGLMAHELTHVAQQGAAAQTMPQRQVQRAHRRTPRQRRVIAGITAAHQSSLADLRARVDVAPP